MLNVETNVQLITFVECKILTFHPALSLATMINEAFAARRTSFEGRHIINKLFVYTAPKLIITNLATRRHKI
jgi:hypothetical protein